MNNNDYIRDKTSYASLIATIIIQIILITLKCSNIVEWSWWIILIPAELSFIAVMIVFLIIGIILIVEMYKDYRKQRTMR